MLRDDHPLPVEQRWRPLGQIAPALQLSVIASEDQKFPDHRGFDFAQIRKAIAERGQRSRGASTITQQVAKNLYLSPSRSLSRKLFEAYLSAWIEACWPKLRILEIYLNIAEFGPGVFGAEAASREFFGKPASHLSPHEAALLAAVLPSPSRFSAAEPSRYVRERAREIEQQVRQIGGPRLLARLREHAKGGR